MAGMLGGHRQIDARLGRKTSNALELVFRAGPGEPVAVARQGAGDRAGGKLGTLLGFKNGGTGKHSLTAAEGRKLWITTRSGEPSLVTEASTDAAVGTLERDSSASLLRDASGRTRVTIAGDPDGDVRTVDAFRLVVRDASGPSDDIVGRLVVARTLNAYTLLGDIEREIIWWGKAAPLKLPLLGCALELTRDLDATTEDLLAAACVDICIGLRPYVAEMR